MVTVMHNQGQYPVQQVPNPPPYMQGGYPMQQPGQGNYPMAPTPYGAGIPMQNPCPPYNPGMAPNSSGSAPPNIAYAGDQGGYETERSTVIVLFTVRSYTELFVLLSFDYLVIKNVYLISNSSK